MLGMTNWTKRLLAYDQSYFKFVRILKKSLYLKEYKWNDIIFINVVYICLCKVLVNLYENYRKYFNKTFEIK